VIESFLGPKVAIEDHPVGAGSDGVKQMTAALVDEVTELRRANAELQRRLDEALAREAATAEILKESLEYQTATSDVLRGISRSTFDLQPVLDTLVETAARLCCADIAHIATRDGDVYRPKARFAMSVELDAFVKDQTYTPSRGTMTARTLLEKRIVHVADIATDPEYAQPEAQRLGGFRSVLGVPLMRDDAVVGAIVLGRLRVEPFTDKQIELVTTFADQAVIAIENVRLLTETREALDQQTATAEVLQVINSSPDNLAPVFDAILEKAMRLCEVAFGILFTPDREYFQAVAARGVPPALAEYLRHPFTVPPGSTFDELVSGVSVVQLPDVGADHRPASDARRAAVELGGARTALSVALRKDDEFLGAFFFYRQEVRPFSDKQIALLQNFAAQAVIAMENARLLGELRERTHDLEESLGYQTATSDVLQVISRSTFDLQPVLDTLVETAARLCSADLGLISSREVDGMRVTATFSTTPEYEAFIRGHLLPPGRGSIAGRAFLERRAVQIPDLIADPEFTVAETVTLGKMRTALGVPLMRQGEVIGAISLARQRVEPFTQRQLELVSTFADQAVIAIENTRLITETREALEQQTATAEVLQVINSSPGDLAPVFEAMLEKAVRLCNADQGALFHREGEVYQPVAHVGLPTKIPLMTTPGNRSVTGQALLRREIVQVADIATDPEYAEYAVPETITAAMARTAIGVPLLREGQPIGVFGLARRRVEPFTDKQIALLQNFAAQAVIAMENARLLTETREALEQQTATAEVLQVINSSPGDLAPVFDTILEKAHTLCGAAHGLLLVRDEEEFRLVAVHGESRFAEGWWQLGAVSAVRPVEGGVVTRLMRGEAFVHIADCMADDSYSQAPAIRSLIETGRVRTALAVPLRKDGGLLGLIVAFRLEVRPFTDNQIALLESFAAQAVIAMENARLLSEIRQRQAELRVTFDNMVDGVAMFDGELRLAAWNRNFQELLDLPDDFLAERHGFDEYVRYLVERGEFGQTDPETEIHRLRGRLNEHYQFERTRPDGTVIEVRNNPMPDGGIVLIYSDITERKRSEAEIRAARDAAEAAYRDLKAAQASLIQAEKMASLGQLTAGIAHEIKNPLNFVNNFADLSVELLDELKETAAPAINALGDEKRAEIDETITMLTGNLEKIAEHGRRADGIVKSMLEHSRGTSGERRSVDLNGLIEEALNLAYHGARAQDASFNITLERDFAEVIVPIVLVPQDITRVCLNLIGNGFYAATKRQKEGSDPSFKPTLKVSTRDLGDAVEIRVRDNGTGIAPEIKDKLFQPFFTTKPTGEGTGLGLSISYDIVTQQHGGTIAVDSRVGEFTEFTVRLPRAYRTTIAEAAS
jgi:PAS domain S-box-containing protein